MGKSERENDLEAATQIYWMYSKIWYSGEAADITVEEFFDQMNDLQCNRVKPNRSLQDRISHLVDQVIERNDDCDIEAQVNDEM